MISVLLGGIVAAFAGPVDIYGFDARTMGRGGGGVALSDGPGDLFRNPALLQQMELFEAQLGYTLARSSFAPFPDVYWDTNQDGIVDDTDTPLQPSSAVDPADALTIGLGRPVGDRFGLAIAAYVPKDRLLRIDTFDSSLPNWFMYANRPHRYELMVGFGWEQFPGVSVGGAVEMVTRVRMRITLTLDVGVTGAGEGDESLGDLVDQVGLDVHQLEVDLVPAFAPVASLAWDVGELIEPLDGLHLGMSYRGRTGLPVDVSVDLQGNISAEELGELEPLVVVLLSSIQMDIFDHYVPDRLLVGAAWDEDPVRLYVDLERTWWNFMRLNVVQSEGTLDTQLLSLPDNTIADRNPYSLELSATTSVRAGGEFAFAEIPLSTNAEYLRFRVRGGGGLVPSPLVSQGGKTALIDADRMVLSAGFGAEHRDPFELVGGPVNWDIHATMQLLASGQLDVGDATPYRPGAPVDGASIPVGGKLWSAGAQCSLAF